MEPHNDSPFAHVPASDAGPGPLQEGPFTYEKMVASTGRATVRTRPTWRKIVGVGAVSLVPARAPRRSADTDRGIGIGTGGLTEGASADRQLWRAKVRSEFLCPDNHDDVEHFIDGVIVDPSVTVSADVEANRRRWH